MTCTRLFLLSILVLTACGGGGTSGSTTPPPPSSSGFSVGGTVSGLAAGGVLTLKSGSDVLSITATGTFRFPTAVPSGGSYSVEVVVAPAGQTCAVTNGARTGISGDVVDVMVACAKPQSVYVLRALGFVSQFSIDQSGTLASLSPSTVAAPISSYSIAVDPVGRSVYVASVNANTVSQYTIGPSGSLAPMGTPTVPSGAQPSSVSTSPDGRFVYVTNGGDDTVSHYATADSGALSLVSVANVRSGSAPSSITVDRSGTHAYVVNAADATVSLFSVGSTGVLSAINLQAASVGGNPGPLVFDPTGAYAYVPNQRDRTISQFAVGADGELVPMSTPMVLNTPAAALVFDPRGRYAYATNPGGTGRDVSEYRVESNGALTPIVDTNFLAVGGNGSKALVIDRSGQFLYVLFGANNVVQYVIQADGTLTVIVPSSVATGGLDAVGMVVSK